MKSYFRAIMILSVVAMELVPITPAFGATIFSDGTFNLSNYTINSYPTNGDTVNITQTNRRQSRSSIGRHNRLTENLCGLFGRYSACCDAV